MSTRSTLPGPVPEVGLWAQEKLERLGRYLSEYTTILANQRRQNGDRIFTTYYIDAFAGGGVARVRSVESEPAPGFSADLFGAEPAAPEPEVQQVIDGSPRVALNLTQPFDRLRFIERNPRRVALLRALQDEHPGRDIKIIEQDCNQWLREKVIGAPAGTWQRTRAVVFLDPFGMHVPWDIIEGLGALNGVEIILNYPLHMAIQRLMPKGGSLKPEERERIDAYFGDPSWYDIVYKAQPGLFSTVISKADDANERLLTWYCERLRGAFRFVSPACPIKNSIGGTLYYLIHAGNNETGHRIASHVLEMDVKTALRPKRPRKRR